jgi:hypothetical protein
MFGMKYSSIFRNRWYAILWAAGIIWLAYDVAETAKPDAPEANNAAQANESADAIGDLHNQILAIENGQ